MLSWGDLAVFVKKSRLWIHNLELFEKYDGDKKAKKVPGATTKLDKSVFTFLMFFVWKKTHFLTNA